MAVSHEKIAVYSLADLKNTSDDAIPAYLNSLGFKQSHTLSDTRLALGYSAFAICAATFYWDYKLGFEATKFYTAAAVALYTLLNGALTFWIWFIEDATVYVGTDPKTSTTLRISSTSKKHTPIYNLTIKITTRSDAPKAITISRPFSQWFDTKGHFVAEPFQRLFSQGVSAIGVKDRERRREKEETVGGKERTMDEKWASLLAESEGVSTPAEEELGASSSAATPSGRGSKRRAKKA